MLITVFMGSDPIALPLLEAMTEQTSLVGVFTQPDRRAGRGMKLRPNAIKLWAEAQGTPVRQPVPVSEEDLDWLRDQGVDLIVVMAFGQILRQPLLDLAPLGCVNLHASLLPRLRGASPIETAVALGLPETGVSLMRIVRKLDAGPVLQQERVAISDTDNALVVREKLALATARLWRAAWPVLSSGQAVFQQQEVSGVSYCRILEKADGELDFSLSAQALHNRIRGFQPWPGALFYHADQPIKVGGSRVVSTAEVESTLSSGLAYLPGQVQVTTGGELWVCTGEGWLSLTHCQRPGGKMLSATDFLRGYALRSGEVLPFASAMPLEAAKPFRRTTARQT